MKFRKRPIIIEAEQWVRGKEIEGVYCVHCENEIGVWEETFFIDTLEGRMKVSDGDWIITGVEGERYPCKDSIFKASYEGVQE